MSPRWRAWKRSDLAGATVLGAVLLAVLLGTLYAAKIVFTEYPSVTSQGPVAITSSSVLQPGDDLTWTQPEVCLPPGQTTVFEYAVPVDKYVTDNGAVLINSKRIAVFTVNASKGWCQKPASTLITLPSTLYPGTYRIRIESYTENRSPWDATNTSWSPAFTVVRGSVSGTNPQGEGPKT